MHIVTICQAEAAVLLAATQAAADQIKDAVKAAQPHCSEDDQDHHALTLSEPTLRSTITQKLVLLLKQTSTILQVSCLPEVGVGSGYQNQH